MTAEKRVYLNRLSAGYPYLDKNGFPDLVYDSKTNVYACFYCERNGCRKCFKTGYLFLDSLLHDRLINDLYTNKK